MADILARHTGWYAARSGWVRRPLGSVGRACRDSTGGCEDLGTDWGPGCRERR
ncbi:MAG: hypothetical protein IPJ15_07625 [Actinomycetales bacterium]|nr:hypothetical protein [Candidatus Phosphoribacter baldrii]